MFTVEFHRFDIFIRGTIDRVARRRPLQYETLEDRVVMDAGGGYSPYIPDEITPDNNSAVYQNLSATLENGTIKVFGSANDDNITIEYAEFQGKWDLIPKLGTIVTIQDINGQTIFSQTFLWNYLTPFQVEVYAGSGNDTVMNESGSPSIIYGGPGNDTLFGGFSDDQIFGEDGLDGLFGGGGGNDHMDGGSDADRLLFSSDWNSNLVTWGTSDAKDTLLIFQSEKSAVYEKVGEPDFTFPVGQWTLNEIRTVDEVLSFMHHKQANTSLLPMQTFHRVGMQDPHPSGDTILGWNDNSGSIYIAQNSAIDEDRFVQTILHEIGHNWDNENPEWTKYKAISSWTDTDPETPIYNQSTNGKWWYRDTAHFARDYGRTNPREDFATAFAAYFMDELGRPYKGTWQDGVDPVGASVIPAKIAFIDKWLFSIADNQNFFSSDSFSDLTNAIAGNDHRKSRSNTFANVGGLGRIATLERADNSLPVNLYLSTDSRDPSFMTDPPDGGQEDSKRDITSEKAVSPKLVDQAMVEVLDKLLI